MTAEWDRNKPSLSLSHKDKPFSIFSRTKSANNIKSIVKSLKSGQVEIKNDKDGNIGASIGKKSFSDEKIKENFISVYEALLKEKPSGVKGDFILSAYLTSSMGVSFKLNLDKS